jgi:hypothetical protein
VALPYGPIWWQPPPGGDFLPVARTLMSAKQEKGGGQECPPHAHPTVGAVATANLKPFTPL